MPANLTPMYHEAEREYKEATSTQDKIAALEKMLAIIPKHKGTDKLQGDLKRRLSKLKQTAQKKKSGVRRQDQFVVKKEGAGQVALTGFANSGKSSILASVTNASTEVTDYPYTTIKPIPGMMTFEDVKIQLVDLPPVSNEATDTWVANALRTADALLLIVDAADDPSGSAELLVEALKDWKIEVTGERIGSESSGVICKKAVLAVNKYDLVADAKGLIGREPTASLGLHEVALSTENGTGLDDLRRALFLSLDILRVYTKTPGKKPDYRTPFILKGGSTVLDLADRIHNDLCARFSHARIWGKEKYDGQMVNRDHVLSDGDVIEIKV